MKKPKLEGRVLARVLAEDLRRVSGFAAGATVGATDQPRKDITNGPTDFDIPPPA
jgi:hypothetical protein